ncbi:protein LURP-one-related 8-like [Nymphaea colorata]|nr:protein LURP-one-related 8-like [Nymphaea colorata]
MMTRVHSTVSPDESLPSSSGCKRQDVLTVWKKSLLLNCSGFTVFNSKGELVFRVDNYCNDNREEMVLMDAAGKPLVTMRKKKLCLGDQWQLFEGEPKETRGSPKPIYCVKKHSSILKNPKNLAHIFDGSCKNFQFVVHGSYTKRSCQVIDESGRVVAETKMKETVCGVNYTDVFQLIVQPDFDAATAMATVLLLDRMFSSRWSPIF